MRIASLAVLFALFASLLFAQEANKTQKTTATGEPYEIFQYYKVTKKDQKGAAKKRANILKYLYGDSWNIVARFNRIDPKFVWAGKKLKVPIDLEYAKTWSPLPERLTNVYSKSILINLQFQALGVYQDGELQFWIPISSGRKDNPTPTGAYEIMAKHRDHTSSIYMDAAGNNVKMPWALMFHISRDGVAYWIHGGDLPGYRASHGCIRLFNEDAKKLFLWISPDGDNGRYIWIKKPIIPVIIR